MAPKTKEDLARYCRMTSLPFVVKGILSREDAEDALAAGAAGLYVSNHHGNLASTVPPAAILPEMAELTGGRVPIFMDGAVRNGQDAFKALALGADAVCIGFPLFEAIRDGGEEAAGQLIREMTAELQRTMSFTRSLTTEQISSSSLQWSDEM